MIINDYVKQEKNKIISTYFATIFEPENYLVSEEIKDYLYIPMQEYFMDGLNPNYDLHFTFTKSNSDDFEKI